MHLSIEWPGSAACMHTCARLDEFATASGSRFIRNQIDDDVDR
jgi:hypothetical protein